VIENIIFEVVPHPSYSPNYSLFVTLKKHLQGINLKLLWQNGTEDSQNISTATVSKNLFRACNVVSNGKMRHGNKAHILNCILCFVPF
jgi:hypothetical protein